MATQEKAKDKLERYGLIIGIIVGIVGLVIGSLLSGIALIQSTELSKQSIELAQQANNLTQTSLYLENITSNFQPRIIPYFVSANIGDIYTNTSTDYFGDIYDTGSLNLSLIVITPHASVLNFSDTFNIQIRSSIGSDDWINASSFSKPYANLTPQIPIGGTGLNYNLTGVTITNLQLYNYWPEAFVQPGVTQINFTIPIYASIPINSNFSSILIGASLGTVKAQVNLFDIQTNKTVGICDCSTALKLNVNVRNY